MKEESKAKMGDKTGKGRHSYRETHLGKDCLSNFLFLNYIMSSTRWVKRSLGEKEGPTQEEETDLFF